MDVPYAVLSHRWDGPDREQSYQQVCAIQTSYRNSSALQVLLCYLGHILLWILPEQAIHFPSVLSSAPLANLRTSLALRLLVWVHFINSLANSWAHPSVLNDPRLSRKIRDACAYARADGHKYLWIDSCCLDKSSSSELSEAINAMYRWYEIAVVCYAYLSDARSAGEGEPEKGEFFHSQWHTRGWTLQELLAPDIVVFLSAHWRYLGTKGSLATTLQMRLDIHPLVLMKVIPIRDIPVAKVMSWAASRETTREEDRAYCLMGLFGVHMPTLYGEGNRAFIRLQQAIWERKPDASVFAWNYTRIPKRIEDLDRYCVNLGISEGTIESLSRVGRVETHRVDYLSHFATHPADYLIGRTIKLISSQEFADYLGNAQFNSPGWGTLSPNGAPSPVPYIPMKVFLPPKDAADTDAASPGWLPLSKLYLVPVPCTWRTRESKMPEGLLAIVCTESPHAVPTGAPDEELPAYLAHDFTKVLRAVTLHDADHKHTRSSSRLVLLTRADIAKCRSSIYPGGSLFCDPHRSAPSRLLRLPPVRGINHVEQAVSTSPSVQLAGWTHTLLREREYQVTRLESLPAVAVQSDMEPGEDTEWSVKADADSDVGADAVSDVKADIEAHSKTGLETDANVGEEPNTKANTKSVQEASTAPDEKEPILGYKLEKKGLVIMVQHSQLRRLTFETHMRMRVGLVEAVPPAVASPDVEGERTSVGEAPPGRVAWTRWKVLREGGGFTGELHDPRNKEDAFFLRAMLRYHSRDVYNLSLELLTVTVKTKTSQIEAVPSISITALEEAASDPDETLVTVPEEAASDPDPTKH